MVQWDSGGLKGVEGRFEINIHPVWDGWTAIIWINKTHIATLESRLSKADSQKAAEQYITTLSKTTDRLLERIGYNEDEGAETEDE